ncbi:MAG: Tm-1-like ATP-binding domain-containing protein [Negativicutes bacterium]|nr:Tm-1-like ATP-binding domain-containing protein [Negativicutes bacterium]
MKTVAIIACYDTKHQEIDFIYQRIKETGCRPLFIDVSTSAGFRSKADIPREEVAKAAGVEWSSVEGGPKHELLDVMARGCTALLLSLYQGKKVDGVISIGGLQNTMIGSTAMRALPIGVPKIMVSTVACGQRKFELVVGTKDITVIPAITDFGGMNIISDTVLGNAVGAMAGMLQYAGRELPASEGALVGATMMGATDKVIQAIEKVQKSGYPVACFHSTGVGGKVMEELIEKGTVTGVMDLTLHEVVYEYFGKGFGYGADHRLESGVKKGIPMVVCPGGVEFICKWKYEFTGDDHQRTRMWHNPDLAHIKLSIQEITDICNIIIDRLNKADPEKVVVLIPTKGFRTFAKKGEALYDPEGDRVITELFAKRLSKDIPVKYLDASIVDPEFSDLAANEMIRLIKKQMG